MSGLKVSRRLLMKVAWVVAVLLPVAAIAVAGIWLGRPLQAAAPAPTAEEVTKLESFQNGFIAVANAVKPSVVFIEVEQKAEKPAAAEGNSDDNDPMRQFFGPDNPFPFRPTPRPQQQRPSVGQGSGIILDPSGYILTNNHVVRNSASVRVHLENGDGFTAQVVGTDPLTDLAVIKIDAKRPLPAARLGDAGKAQVGSWAIAVGYPFGATTENGTSSVRGVFDEGVKYETTITVGVVSALHRQTDSDVTGYPFRDLIQTDAAINPGNSGGPLVNIRGEVIGINQQIYTSSPMGGNIGLGFAIPIDAETKAVIDTLKTGHKVVRGRLGLSVKVLDPTLKKVMGAQEGVYVQDIEKGGPAARAGIKPEDVIVGYQGKPVASEDEFVDMVRATPPGTKVQVDLVRGGKRQTVEATVEAIAAPTAPRQQAAAEPTKMGVSVDELPAEIAQQISEQSGVSGGVRVRSVEPMSDAARAGLAAGDIILRINREAVTDVPSYQKAVSGLKKGDPVVIRVWRITPQGSGTDTIEIESLSE